MKTAQNTKSLVAAHTRKMLPVEECLARMLSIANNDFDNMTPGQVEFYKQQCERWDKMNSDRNMAILLDAGKMTLAEFNLKKLVTNQIQERIRIWKMHKT